MKAFTITLYIGFVFASNGHELCDKHGTLFYESLSCKPNFSKSGECPTSFDCEDLDGSSDTCLLKGRRYKIGDTIEENLQTVSCKADCSCVRKSDIASFACANVDCPENENWEDSDECYYGYELGQCCSTRKICPPFSNVTCKVDGISYKESDQFYPSNSCTECICKEGFKGEFVEPFCKRINCPVQLDKAEFIAKRCAPVYLTKTEGVLCCPVIFACPTEDLKLDFGIKMEPRRLSCIFGNKTLNIGTSFRASIQELGPNRTASCTCSMPPFVTCVSLIQ